MGNSLIIKCIIKQPSNRKKGSVSHDFGVMRDFECKILISEFFVIAIAHIPQ